MTERKKHLANVAFGGAWTEQILDQQALSEVMEVLRRAADECMDRDVRDREFLAALSFVRENVEKGPMLVEAIQKGLLDGNQITRQATVRRYVEMISEWAGG